MHYVEVSGELLSNGNSEKHFQKKIILMTSWNSKLYAHFVQIHNLNRW